jgi:hypothetical protein
LHRPTGRRRRAIARRDGDAELRRREDRLLRDGGPVGPVQAPVARQLTAAPPRVGEQREFSVLEPGGGFRRVAAVVRWVGRARAFYEDVETPQGQLTAADYAAFGAAFDDPIAPTVDPDLRRAVGPRWQRPRRRVVHAGL